MNAMELATPFAEGRGVLMAHRCAMMSESPASQG